MCTGGTSTSHEHANTPHAYWSKQIIETSESQHRDPNGLRRKIQEPTRHSQVSSRKPMWSQPAIRKSARENRCPRPPSFLLKPLRRSVPGNIRAAVTEQFVPLRRSEAGEFLQSHLVVIYSALMWNRTTYTLAIQSPNPIVCATTRDTESSFGNESNTCVHPRIAGCIDTNTTTQ